MVDSGVTRHICGDKNAFTSYSPWGGGGGEHVYLGDSSTTLTNVLHVSSIRVNLVSVALLGKVGVKVSFKFDKIVMTKNNVFVSRGIMTKDSLCSTFMRLLMNMLHLLLI